MLTSISLYALLAIVCYLYLKYIHVSLPDDVADRLIVQGLCIFIRAFDEIPVG